MAGHEVGEEIGAGWCREMYGFCFEYNKKSLEFF